MSIGFWVASHLTGLFEINDQSSNLYEIGSRGAGISIQRGVTTAIKESDSSSVIVQFNGQPQSVANSLITREIIKLLIPEENQTDFQIHHQFDVPLRSGFGASAAGAVGTAFCINEYFKLGLNDLELFQAAHKAEVITKSGLGDVIGLFQGGLEVRTREGAPGYGETISMQKDDDWKIATLSLGTLSTSSVLSDPLKRLSVNAASSTLIDRLIENPLFTEFIRYCSEFTRNVQLWSPQLRTILDNLPRSIIGAQIMLGDALFLFYTEEDDLADLKISHNPIQPEKVCIETIKRIN